MGTEFTDYQERVDTLDEGMYLGRVTWYALTEGAYQHHGDFCRKISDSGMSWGLPTVPRSHDVFRRVTTEAQRRRQPTSNPDQFINFNFVEVGHDGDHIWRNLVAETVDRADHALDYQVIAEVVFARNTNKITWTTLSDGSELLVQEIMDQIVSQFLSQYDLVTPYTLREYVRKIIRNTGATVLRDGVYFIREEYADQIAALDDVVNSIPGGMFHSLPLIDDRKQREMLRQAFEDESVGEIDKLIDEVTGLLRDKKPITSNRFAGFFERYSNLRGKVVDYSDLLDMAMVGTSTRLEVMNDTLGELANLVK